MILHLCLLLLLALPVPAAACDDTPYTPIAQRMQKALLFKLSRCDFPDSYLFGTFHSDSPDLKPIYEQAANQLAKQRQLGLELVLDDAMRNQARAALLLPPDHPGLRHLLGDALFKQVSDTFGPILRADAATLDRYRPWALAVLVQYPPAEADGVVLDEKLQRRARELGKTLFGLETLQEQFGVFEGMSERQQVDFLTATLADADELSVMHTELKLHYLARDLPAIHRMSEALFTEMAADYPALAEYLEAQILVKRNHRMAERIGPALDHPTLIAVGALHLPGEDGLLALLECDGWRIEPVY